MCKLSETWVTKTGPHNWDVYKLFKGNQKHSLEREITVHLTNVQNCDKFMGRYFWDHSKFSFITVWRVYDSQKCSTIYRFLQLQFLNQTHFLKHAKSQHLLKTVLKNSFCQTMFFSSFEVKLSVHGSWIDIRDNTNPGYYKKVNQISASHLWVQPTWFLKCCAGFLLRNWTKTVSQFTQWFMIWENTPWRVSSN